MLPENRFAVTLIASLVLWSPTGRVLVSGDTDIVGAGIRYALAFLVAWIAVAVLDRLITAYACGRGRSQGAGPAHGGEVATEGAQSTKTDTRPAP